MIYKDSIERYFTYDDRLRKTVAVVTGILILIFNMISGFMIVHMVSGLLFGIYYPGTLVLILYIVPGIIVGAGLLKLCVMFIEFVQGKTQIEEYSYIRLVLLVSIGIYLLILLFYVILTISLAAKGIIISAEK